jgi:D-xylose transport system permease protein
MVGALLGIWLIFNTVTDGTFLTPRNLWNLVVQTSVVGIIATGMVLVIVSRQIDLSVGSLLGFVGMIMAAAQVEWFGGVPLGWLIGAL